MSGAYWAVSEPAAYDIAGTERFVVVANKRMQMTHSPGCAMLHWLPDVSSTRAGAPNPQLAVACATLSAAQPRKQPARRNSHAS